MCNKLSFIFLVSAFLSAFFAPPDEACSRACRERTTPSRRSSDMNDARAIELDQSAEGSALGDHRSLPAWAPTAGRSLQGQPSRVGHCGCPRSGMAVGTAT